MQSIPSSPLPQAKTLMSKWWWVSLLACWILCWVVGALLVATRLTSSDRSASGAQFNDAYTKLFIGVGFFALGLIVMITFWIIFGIRQKQNKKLLDKSLVQPSTSFVPTVTFATPPKAAPSVQSSPHHGHGTTGLSGQCIHEWQQQQPAAEFSEQYMQGPQKQQYYISGQQPDAQVSNSPLLTLGNLHIDRLRSWSGRAQVQQGPRG